MGTHCHENVIYHRDEKLFFTIEHGIKEAKKTVPMNFTHQSFNFLRYSKRLCNTVHKKTNDIAAATVSARYGMAVGTQFSVSFQRTDLNERIRQNETRVRIELTLHG
jgi:hypothetical protein